MSSIHPDILSKLTPAQNQIWQTVSLTMSESTGVPITFGNPLTVATKTSDLYGELTVPMLILQFAFAGLPENAQVVLIPQETVVDLASLINGTQVLEADENLLSDIRPAIESVIQGICLAVGNLKNEPIVASGLSIRFQVFSFPPNLQRAEELVRVQVAVSGENLNGSAIWLMDAEVAHAITGVPMTEDPGALPFGQVTVDGAGNRAIAQAEDLNGLELLLDIPLELSVELGRVRMLVKDVVELGTGSIVEIDKAAGEPVDVLVNGRLVARGEVVVIEDNFGVRITEILNPQDRLAKLNEAA